jgi:peptide/nickel transport system substrate-binding protein
MAQNKIKKFHQHDEKLVQKLGPKKKVPSLDQLNYISKYLSNNEKLIIRILSGITVICLVALFINVYWTNSELVPKTGGVYTEGLVGSPRYVNPLFAQANDVDLDITALTFSSLFKYTDEGLSKDLVESYELSSDQLTYTFVLKQNIVWHDGESLDVDDVLFTYNRILDSKTKTPLYFNFQSTTFEKIDQSTFRINLQNPFAPFLESLTVGILPQHIWQNIQPENMLLAEYNLKPIGSGPFQFESLSKTKAGEIKNFKLVRSETYYAGSPYVEELNLKFYGSFDTAVEALNNKKVDGISYLPKEIRARIINNRNLNFNLLNLPQYTAVFFNYTNNPILKDVAIRKILSHGLNKEKIVNEILNAEAQIVDFCILPNKLGCTDDIVKFPYNVQHAKTELEKAGWALTDYNIESTTDENTEETNDAEESEVNEVTAAEQYPYPVRKKGDRYFEFDLTTVNQPETVKIATEIQKEWQQIGAKVNLNIIQTDQIQDIIKERNFETLLYGQILGNDPDPYPFWHSSQRGYPGLNLTSLNSPDIDKLLEDARKTNDEPQRLEKYTKFQTLLAETVPAIFIFNPTYTYPQNKKIKGFNAAKIITPANRFCQVNEWYIQTDRKWSR